MSDGILTLASHPDHDSVTRCRIMVARKLCAALPEPFASIVNDTLGLTGANKMAARDVIIELPEATLDTGSHGVPDLKLWFTMECTADQANHLSDWLDQWLEDWLAKHSDIETFDTIEAHIERSPVSGRRRSLRTGETQAWPNRPALPRR